MICSYEFGKIVVNGKGYSRDLIILGDRVVEGWWRKTGHQLHIEDLDSDVQYRADVLIVGTGYSGCMEVPQKTRQFLKAQGIELVAEKTGDACAVYNRFFKVRTVAAALHLTC